MATVRVEESWRCHGIPWPWRRTPEPEAVAERLVGDDSAKGMPTRVFASAVEGWVAEAAFFADLRPVADDAGTLLRWRNASECTQSGRGPYTIARKLGAGCGRPGDASVTCPY